MGNLIIPESLLDQVKMSPAELRLEMAIHLYQSERLSIGQARKLADLDLISFQKELAKRNIYLNYGMDDLKADIQALGIAS